MTSARLSATKSPLRFMAQGLAEEGRDEKPVIASASEAIQERHREEKWIASSRSLSSGAHSRDPLAPRNDSGDDHDGGDCGGADGCGECDGIGGNGGGGGGGLRPGPGVRAAVIPETRTGADPPPGMDFRGTGAEAPERNGWGTKWTQP